MQGRTGRVNRACVAGYNRVYKIVVHVAVEDLSPLATEWKSGGVVVPGVFRKGRNDDNVLARSFQPAMKCDHPILIVNVKWVHVVAPQRGIIPAKPDQFLRKT